MDQKRAATSTCGGRGEAYYQRLLSEQESSGQSLRAFAAERGLSAWTLYGWRGKLGRSKRRYPLEDSASKEGGFVAVDVVAGSRPAEEVASGFEVVLADGCCVRAPRDITIARLAELVRALRSC